MDLSKRQARKQNRRRKVEAFVKLAMANHEDRLEHMKRTLPDSSECETTSEKDGVSPSKRSKLEGILGESDVQAATITEQITVKREKNIALLDVFLLHNEELEQKRRQIIERRKLIMQLPAFRLLEKGVQAERKLDGDPCHVPIQSLDVICLLRKLMKSHNNLWAPQWVKLERPTKITHTVVVLADGVSANDICSHHEILSQTKKTFDMMVEVKPNLRQSLNQTILSLATDFTGNGNAVIEPEPMSLPNSKEANDIERSTCERTQLLLSLDQMERENYPLVKECQSDYVCTKKEYAAVTNSSPLFGIDCEMCDTSAGKELTRVAIVNENFGLIYDEYVKPDNEITDYLTCFSGITAEILSGVTTRLVDVQKKIRKLLPPDAILCGHSLNCDLHALKMVHPYNIDTSVIYKGSKHRKFKMSLKYLAKIFLNQDIQMGRKGHNPVEDGSATLRLVLLKLQNGISFGDAAICRDYEVLDTNAFATELKLRKQIIASLYDSQKKVKMITSDASTILISSASNASSIVSSNKEVTELTCKEINENDLLIAHMKLKSGDEKLSCSHLDYKNLDKRLKKIFDSCTAGSLLFVLFDNSSASNLPEIENSLLMMKIKSIL